MNQELLKKEIINIFVIGIDTLNRQIKKYNETGSIEPCKRTKYREKEAPEERALFFSVKHHSVYARMKALGITRKKDVNSAE